MRRFFENLAWVLGLALLCGVGTWWLTGADRSLEIEPSWVRLDSVRISEGDDPRWALQQFDDSLWRELPFGEVPGGERIFWLRGQLDLEPLSTVPKPLGIQLATMATCEVYWDGKRLDGSGSVGVNRIEEVPGELIQELYVPDSLSLGSVHQVALRCSTFHRGFEPSLGFWYLAAGDYGTLAKDLSRNLLPGAISFSAMVIVGLFYLLLFALDRKDRPALILGVLALTGALLLVAESWRSLVVYTYDWHFTRLLVVTAVSGILNFLLALFFCVRFPLSFSWRPLEIWGKGIFLGVSLLLIVLPTLWVDAWDPKAGFMFLGVGSWVLGWSLVAVYKEMTGSLLASIGVASLLTIALANPYVFLDQSLFIALNLLLMCLLASHALQVREARREREAANLKSARLEIELLRRHIQPHFLMNTLTALAEWFEEEPATASRMLQSLGEEFRVLGTVSNQKLISLGDELRLCRSHLEVMSLRKDRRYTLVVDEIDTTQRIPPAVLHTLVENAITHDQGEGSIEISLSSRDHQEMRLYRLDVPLAGSAGHGECREGTGLRYVRARLQESFGDSYSLHFGPVDGLWRTEIGLPRTH